MEFKRPSRASQVMPKIRALAVGESVSFPIEWIDTVRTQACKCSMLTMERRRVQASPQERVVYVRNIG